RATGASQVAVEVGADGTSRLLASAPLRSKKTLVSAADALARELSARGYRASARVEPRTEARTGNVYAMALAKLSDEIAIYIAAKESEAEIAEDIRQQLASEGFGEASVEVSKGEHSMTVELGKVDGLDPSKLQVSVEGKSAHVVGVQLKLPS